MFKYHKTSGLSRNISSIFTLLTFSVSLLAIYRFNRSADRKLSTRHFNDCSCDKINIQRHEIVKEVVNTDQALE